ncbi:hypothetical protein N7490_003678 [Penicillium lividum]|nr:hypothetical protein N7490_003678 [Penicillium lividum]
MRARKTGTLLFAGCAGLYNASSYVGSKALLEGIVTHMADEIAPFGLRTSIVMFGYFRTELFAPGNIKCSAPNRLPDYAELDCLVEQICTQADGTQAGNPRKACELVVEAVRGRGGALVKSCH